MNGCFYFTDPLRKAEKALQRGHCEQAKHFFLPVKDSKKKKFAEKAAKMCASKNVKVTIWFYMYLSERGIKEHERLSFKEHLADIYFTKQRSYEKAIEEYSFLEKQKVSNKKKYLYSFRIALSFFELGKWEMSLKEVEKLLSMSLEEKDFLVALFLKARILLMQKRYAETRKVFKKIQRVDNLFFEKNKLFLYLSFIYELQKDFDQAVMELKDFQNTSEFLKEKIRRLEIRQSKQPGAVYF